MSEEAKKSLLPHLVIGVLVLIVILAILFWPSEPTPDPLPVIPQPIVSSAPQPEIEVPSTVLEETAQQPVVEPEIEVTPDPIIAAEPEPLDISDGAVKTKLLALSDYDAFARLLINEALLQRFVIMTSNLADDNIAANNRMLAQPEKPFRTYQQADKEWIDPASYKRYAPYVEVFESLETESMLQLYEEYKPAIEEIFAEIGNPSDQFDEKLIEAIDVLLDTPEVPVPVEVFTDSVMYKFADSRLEKLSAPQKQLLRTGPENMRRIKAKLRELKEIL